jgi:DNA uptake protein ComE-like DNA-binding protein
LPKPEVRTINVNAASLEELANILQLSEPFARKIITLKEKLREFKEPQDLTQLSEITNLEWEEWKEQGISINIE